MAKTRQTREQQREIMLALRERLGAEFFRDAGRKGGEVNKENRNREYFQSIGKIGGRVTADEYGRKHYQEIGRKGGLSTSPNKKKSKFPREHYVEMGKKGRAARDANSPIPSLREYHELRVALYTELAYLKSVGRHITTRDLADLCGYSRSHVTKALSPCAANEPVYRHVIERLLPLLENY